MSRILHMCCGEHGVFVQMEDLSCWWRRHEWLSDVWQPVGMPPASPGRGSEPEAKAVSKPADTAKPKPKPRRHRR